MSVNNYQQSGGLPPISPNQVESTFRSISRDKLFDVYTITQKIKLAKRAAITAQKFYGTARLDGLDVTEITMPFEGNIDITVIGATAGDLVLINCPFVDTPETHFVLNTSPDSNAILERGSPGQLILTLTDGLDGVYSVSVNSKKKRVSPCPCPCPH